MSKRVWLPLAVIGGLVLAVLLLVSQLFVRVENSMVPDPVSVASASLDGLREQNRLIVFEASYNAAVTTTLTRMGLSARKTLLMPGRVRYELDLAKLDEDDVRWDADSETLSIRLPPVEIAPPQVQMEKIQTYDDGGILIALTDAETVLDQANRRKGVAELSKQANNPVQLRLARDAARRAVASSFALPLKAAGMTVKVDAFFPGERNIGITQQWDLSRPISEVLADRNRKGEAP